MSKRRGIGSLASLLVIAAAAFPAAADPGARPREQALRGWHLIEYDLEPPVPPELALRTLPDELKEQFLELVPGETLQSVARSLVDKRLQLRFSPQRAVVVIRMPLG